VIYFIVPPSQAALNQRTARRTKEIEAHETRRAITDLPQQNPALPRKKKNDVLTSRANGEKHVSSAFGWAHMYWGQ